MNYFAKLNDNMVVEVILLTDTIENGVAWCVEQYGGVWVQTYFEDPNKTFANLGYKYLESEEDFRSPQPYPSWTWANKTWNPPTPRPSTGGPYEWSEEELEWVAI